ncbi:MAG: GNAT family N-acetyltransferase [Flavobacteriales bacterium CG_4_9_14_3_um_filter_40_17]|nr:MAG: GNAT family N-acetyltransferase [Flavobacteriales bacterium CG_4_9_14_3_um_filter_40_17]
MIKIGRTSTENPDFMKLVKQLDADLAVTDGDEHAFYDQFNKLDAIKYVLLAFENETAVGCGAIKEFDAQTMEIKRMYVAPDYRGKGIASEVLTALEKWAAELGYATCILETGTRQSSAIRLYQKNGYQQTPNYGQYAQVQNSLCFEKKLKEWH